MRSTMERIFVAALALALAGAAPSAPAFAKSSYMSGIYSAYPSAENTRIDSCSLCHTSSIPTRNSYGAAWRNASRSHSAIAGLDSDNDGFLNSVEIAALTFPGDAADHPAPAADTTAPTVTAFVIPAAASSITVPVTTFNATDAVGVTGYLLTETAGAPAAGNPGWSASKPTSHTFASPGAHTLYAWAKDAAGNVSTSRSDSVTITLADTTAPTVLAFTIPATSSSLTVAVSAFSVSDDVGVTGYLLTGTAGAPTAGNPGWSGSVPTSHTFASAGAHTLYAWAKDAAGNVSTSRSDSVTITLADATAPTVTVFVIPAAASSLTVPVTTFNATDAVGVTGYLLTETAGAPAAGNPGWSASKPTSHTFASEGAHTLYAWAKDAAGNVSTSLSADVTIAVAPPPTVLYEDEFPEYGGNGSWEQVQGYFGLVGGRFVALQNGRQIALVEGVPELDPLAGGSIETAVRLRRPLKSTTALLIFDYQDEGHYRYVRLDRRRKQLVLGQVGTFAGDEGGIKARRRIQRLFKPVSGRWHRFSVALDAVTGDVAVTVDNASGPALTFNFVSTGIGRAGLGSTRGRLRVQFDNFEVTAPALP